MLVVIPFCFVTLILLSDLHLLSGFSDSDVSVKMRLFWLLLLSGGATSLASNSINLLPSGTLARSGTGTVALGTATSSGGTAPSAVSRTHTTLGPSAGKTSARLSWNGPFGNSTATQSGTAGSVLPSGSSVSDSLPIAHPAIIRRSQQL